MNVPRVRLMNTIIIAITVLRYFSQPFHAFSLALNIHYLDLWQQFRVSVFAVCGWHGCTVLRHGPRVLNQDHAGEEGGAEGYRSEGGKGKVDKEVEEKEGRGRGRGEKGRWCN